MSYRIPFFAIIAVACMTAHATSPMPIDLALSLDVKAEQGKEAVFDVVRTQAATQGFTCKALSTTTFGRDVLILHCQKPAVHPPSVHSIVASDNLGLALFEIDGYFGGEPEPVFTLISAIEHDVKQIDGITVRAIRTRSDQYADPDKKRALEELARRAADHWRQTCAEKPSHPACLQHK